MNYKNDAIFSKKKFNREQCFSLSAELLSRLVNNELWLLVCVVTLNCCNCTTMLKTKHFGNLRAIFRRKLLTLEIHYYCHSLECEFIWVKE